MGILEILADKKLIKKEDISKVSSELRAPGADLESVLLRRGLSRESILESKGEALGVPFRNLDEVNVSNEVLRFLPEESAAFYQIVPIGFKDGVLEIGVVNPESMESRDALTFISSKIDLPFKLFLITLEDFERILELYKGLSGEVTQALSDLENELSIRGKDLGLSTISKVQTEEGGETRIIEEAPVTKIVATILHYATEGSASDIHVEPIGEKVRVRFRVDGELATSLILPNRVLDAVVARIKILSNMRLDEKRKPQDGRFSAKIEGRKIDFRVSTFPTNFGEKIVMRILDTQKGVKSLDEMGLSKRNLEKIRDAVTRPFGLVLISGPTGSGKSTTLYSMLREIDFEKENGLSLEDPVEYSIPGMNQSQVRPEIGYSFANGLRSTLRQDPDIIMVGEIRDKETAQLAVQAALTGHLVLSTIHTNNAIGVIPRLIDMGIDKYLIAPTLVLIMAQRLVNLLCSPGKPFPIEGSVRMFVEEEFQDVSEEFRKEIIVPKEMFEVKPSAVCPKGTRGRTAVFEVIRMDKNLEGVILKDPTEAEIMKVARKQGMFTMKEDAMFKAFRGEISFEEVNKL